MRPKNFFYFEKSLVLPLGSSPMRLENGLEKLSFMPDNIPHPGGQEGNGGVYNPNKIDLHIQQEETVTIVTLRGDSITAANAASLKAQLTTLFAPRAKIVLDLEAIRFVDSAGIGVIMACIKSLKSMNGSMKICQVTSPVIALFKLVKLDRLLDIHAGREEAVKSFH